MLLHCEGSVPLKELWLKFLHSRASTFAVVSTMLQACCVLLQQTLLLHDRLHTVTSMLFARVDTAASTLHAGGDTAAGTLHARLDDTAAWTLQDRVHHTITSKRTVGYCSNCCQHHVVAAARSMQHPLVTSA
jgi:hypothetical protein